MPIPYKDSFDWDLTAIKIDNSVSASTPVLKLVNEYHILILSSIFIHVLNKRNKIINVSAEQE